jgi:hypothetical protein
MPDVSVLSPPVPETIRAFLIERNLSIFYLHDLSSDSSDWATTVSAASRRGQGVSTIENAIDNSKPYAIKPARMA